MNRPIVRGPRAFTLIDTLLVIVILGILAAIVIPRYTNATDEAIDAALLTQLQSARRQIELYNLNHPSSPFDPMVPGGPAAWDQLVQNHYLQGPPTNPLQFNLSTVGMVPAQSIAWVWTDLGNGLHLYAVGEDGTLFDGDGDGKPD
jgi:general secretion pathway protein G